MFNSIDSGTNDGFRHQPVMWRRRAAVAEMPCYCPYGEANTTRTDPFPLACVTSVRLIGGTAASAP